MCEIIYICKKIIMEHLNVILKNLLNNTKTDFKRYLYSEINWNSRLIAIIGARGTGKTTLMLQRIKLSNEISKSMYVSLDNIYFSNNNVFDYISKIYNYGIRYIYLDEVHKYKSWSREIKNIYDSYPDIKIVFSGSSMLDIYKGMGDLSRRAISYKLSGLSFREFLSFETGKSLKPVSLENILQHKFDYDIENPLLHFKNYLHYGYYPFYKDDAYAIRLNEVINTVLEYDIPKYMDLRISTIDKIKHLLMIISENVPFKPNYNKIAELLNVSRNSVPDYFSYLEKAGLIMLLRDETKGIRGLGKVNKVYLNNTNLMYALKDKNVNIGTIRETFFMNQILHNNNVFSVDMGDFKVNDIVFEVGGINKAKNQVKGVEKAFIVKDDLKYGFGNVVPLWGFGMMY